MNLRKDHYHAIQSIVHSHPRRGAALAAAARHHCTIPPPNLHIVNQKDTQCAPRRHRHRAASLGMTLSAHRERALTDAAPGRDFMYQTSSQLLATDILALATMKNAAKCDT